MLDSIYHMTLKLLKNLISGMKMSRFLTSFTQRYNGRHVTLQTSLLTTSGLLILLHGIISLPEVTPCDNRV